MDRLPLGHNWACGLGIQSLGCAIDQFGMWRRRPLVSIGIERMVAIIKLLATNNLAAAIVVIVTVVCICIYICVGGSKVQLQVTIVITFGGSHHDCGC